LIEQIVLKPKYQLIVRRMTLDRGAPFPHVVHRVERWIAAGPCPRREVRGTGQEARAHVEQFSVAESAWNGPFVQRIGPDRTEAGKAGGFDGARRGRAVRDVQKAMTCWCSHVPLLEYLADLAGELRCVLLEQGSALPERARDER